MAIQWVMLCGWIGCAACALTAAGAAAADGSSQARRAALSAVDRYNYAVGAQTIGVAYQFTQEPLLVETARAILAMGSNTIKFKLGPDYFGRRGANVPAACPGVATLTDLVRDEPAHRRVLDMPFANYILWVYPFQSAWWDKGLSAADRDKLYREMYDLTQYLLKTYSGTGKTFYLGHWEGDWHLRRGYDTKTDDCVTPAAVQGMIGWLNTRQRAVDDARRATPHRDVQVYHYCEVNLVRLAMLGRKTVTNDVLPKTDVDFVSYSSYDSGVDLKPALDYIQSKLQPKRGISGKRVFIGEYGFPAVSYSPEEQEAKARQVLRGALEWGCPFVLYWEMYNNEVDASGRQRGFWLIDDQGKKTPLYETHRRFYEWARGFVARHVKEHGRPPAFDVFRRAAVEFLSARPE